MAWRALGPNVAALTKAKGDAIMQAITETRTGRSYWRIAGWGLALVLLLTPAVAMQFTSEVNWTPSDFVVAAVMFLVFGTAIELAVRLIRNRRNRILAIIAVLCAFLWLWAELAVGVFTNWGS